MFRFVLSDELEVGLSIFSVLGQVIVELRLGTKQAGVHELRWDGKDASGVELSNGVYFYRLQAGAQTKIRKLLILR